MRFGAFGGFRQPRECEMIESEEVIDIGRDAFGGVASHFQSDGTHASRIE